MSSPFVYELASVQAAVTRDHPDHPTDPYKLPWYLVIGEPGAGRSTAIRSMLLTWPQGSDGMLRLNLPQQLCTHWMANEAVFIEPEAQVLGPNRNPQHLKDLANELRVSRVREPVDGIILVSSIAEFIDLDEKNLEAYGLRLRSYLVEIANAIGADIPVYLILTRYDTLWGFAEVFQWTPDRRREDPWGFNLPIETPIEQGLDEMNKELDGFSARVEAYCLAKLSSEDPPEHRTRAFQHLAELHSLMEKLRVLFKALAGKNAYERTPWFRAVGIGSAVPGTGDRIRAGGARFTNMGLTQGASVHGGSPRPGGLPIHHFVKVAVLPERELVPLRTRWRDDKLIIICAIASVAIVLITIIVAIVFKAIHNR